MKNLNEVITDINEIVDWYRELPMDYTGINDIMYQRIQLTTLLSYYATELGEYRIEWKNAEAETEKVRRQNTRQCLDDGLPYSKAQELGKFYSIDQYVMEKRYDGMYNSMKLYYDNCNAIIDCMNQHISNIKRQYEYEKNV